MGAQTSKVVAVAFLVPVVAAAACVCPVCPPVSEDKPRPAVEVRDAVEVGVAMVIGALLVGSCWLSSIWGAQNALAAQGAAGGGGAGGGAPNAGGGAAPHPDVEIRCFGL